jgi:hypothetical protein
MPTLTYELSLPMSDGGVHLDLEPLASVTKAVTSVVMGPLSVNAPAFTARGNHGHDVA